MNMDEGGGGDMGLVRGLQELLGAGAAQSSGEGVGEDTE